MMAQPTQPKRLQKRLALILLSVGLLVSATASHLQGQGSADSCKNAINPFRSSVKVSCTEAQMYVISNGLPDHPTGSFPNRDNPNPIRPQNHNYRWSLQPAVASSTTNTPFGPMAFAVNGVTFFETGALRYWNNNQNWRENAVIAEVGVDQCNGHPEGRGMYHYHANPVCLYKEMEGQHSPIIGFAFDGFPIYGTRGFVNANGTGGLRTMRTSYQLKQGTRPAPPQGPGGIYDGRYMQDYDFVSNSGDLDQCNGRFSVTPEYPQGIYHYHVTVDEKNQPAFPYIINCYKGTPDPYNFRGGR